MIVIEIKKKTTKVSINMAEVAYRVVFEGAFYKIIEDDEASLLLFEGKPISATCVEHGTHGSPYGCPHVERLMKKIFS